MATRTHWLRDGQNWAVEQERDRHNDALYAFGEYAAFCLLWKRPDFDAGLVRRCLRCFVALGPVADVYQQASDSQCSDCFGIGFEGGYKAVLIRPSLWDYTEEAIAEDRRGTNFSQNASVQTTSDFRLRNGDYIFRADGSRWQMRTVSTNHLRTGFTQDHSDALGYNFGTVAREDEDSSAYQIPPSPALLAATLGAQATTHAPRSYAALETIRGPIL